MWSQIPSRLESLLCFKWTVPDVFHNTFIIIFDQSHSVVPVIFRKFMMSTRQLNQSQHNFWENLGAVKDVVRQKSDSLDSKHKPNFHPQRTYPLRPSSPYFYYCRHDVLLFFQSYRINFSIGQKFGPTLPNYLETHTETRCGKTDLLDAGAGRKNDRWKMNWTKFHISYHNSYDYETHLEPSKKCVCFLSPRIGPANLLDWCEGIQKKF